MKTPKSWTTNNLREVKKTFGRFIAILAIVMLGVGFFAGLKSTKNAMLSTANQYIKEQQLFDYRMISTYGMYDEDVEMIRQKDQVRYAEGVYSFDFLAHYGDSDELKAMKALSMPEQVSVPTLVEGRMPDAPDECVLDAAKFSSGLIGNTIVICDEEGITIVPQEILPEEEATKKNSEAVEEEATKENSEEAEEETEKSDNISKEDVDEEEDKFSIDTDFETDSDVDTDFDMEPDSDKDYTDFFAYSEYKVVGLVNSAQYLNMERGTTQLGNGSITGYVYIPKDGITMDYYTEVAVKLDTDAEIYSDTYVDYCENQESDLEDLLSACGERKYQEIYDEASDVLEDAEEQYTDAVSTYEEKKAEVEEELSDAEKELSDAKEELSDAKKKLDSAYGQIKDGETKLAEGEKTLADNRTKYQEGLAEYEKNKADFDAKKKAAMDQIDKGQKVIDTTRKTLETELDGLKQLLTLYGDQPDDIFQSILQYTKQQVQAMIAELEAGLKQLDEEQTKLDAKKAAAEAEFKKYEEELAKAKTELDTAAKLLEEGQAEFDSQKATFDKAKNSYYKGKRDYDQGVSDYEEGLSTYEDAKVEAGDKFAEAEEKLADAREQIDDGWEKLKDLELPDTYLLDRDTNIGYASFENDSNIVEGISRVFPVFFFLVAALVVITTMTRMVDEQRTQIGTLKALGYSNAKIAMKYMSYSGSAALIGAVIGLLGGAKLFPWAIWKVYGLMYNNFAPIDFVIDWKMATVTILVALLCAVGSTWFACYTELTQMPAELMRPKAPKVGKKIWMEYLPFIWNRMRFLHKVSARNIFRFKKRMFMMLLGIGGCTALIITGFGITDSIINIASDQYDNILKYDYQIRLDNEFTEADQENFLQDSADVLEEVVFVGGETCDAIFDGGTRSVNVIATDDANIHDLVDFSYNDEKIAYPGDGSAIISNGLAEAANVSVGDTLSLKISDTETKEVQISGIFRNYVHHYMFMNSATYQEIFDEEVSYDQALANVVDETLLYESQAKLYDLDHVTNISVSNDFKTNVRDMLNSLNYVVALVILCACSLAFVVLYNLSNINITERIREIATIKVLGLYPSETNSYVFRENFVLTLMGVVVGLPLGYFLHSFVMSEIRIEMVSFNIHVEPISYVYAFVITVIMAILVSLALSRKIEKVNMTESLKSVE